MKKCLKCKKLLSRTGYSHNWHTGQKRCLVCFPLEEISGTADIDVFEITKGYKVPQFKGDRKWMMHYQITKGK